MPYGVGKRDACPVSRPWAVYKIADGGEQIVNGGCHATRAGALAQQRALYARESASYPTAPGEEPAMREHLIAPVLEWKTVSGGSGELEGYVSVFGNVDQGGDVVLPGAFKKTLADWRGSKQPLPLIADHDLSTDGVIGSVREAKEDPVGLWVRAGFSSTAKAQDIRIKMIEGHLKGMSFTYEAVKHYMGQMAGKSARFLQELRLFEATVTPFPMNTLALASAKADHGNISTPDAADLDAAARRYAVSQGWAMPDGSYPVRPANLHGAQDLAKAIRAVGRGGGSHDAIRRHIMARARAIGMSDQIPDNWSASGGSSSLDFEAWADAMRKALDITYGPAQKAAASALLGAYDPELDAAGDPDGDITADAATQDEEGTAEDRRSEAARYAHAIIAKPSGPHDGAPGGEPPGVALAGPLAPLEVERAAQEMDRLEADINAALGRST
jgi:HK97 family phage prohead protease